MKNCENLIFWDPSEEVPLILFYSEEIKRGRLHATCLSCSGYEKEHGVIEVVDIINDLRKHRDITGAHFGDSHVLLLSINPNDTEAITKLNGRIKYFKDIETVLGDEVSWDQVYNSQETD